MYSSFQKLSVVHVVIATVLLSVFVLVQAQEENYDINAAPESEIEGRATCLLTESILKSGQRSWTVKLHNKFRRWQWAKNMRRVSWGKTIANRAQALANTCNFQHGMLQFCDGRQMGQNLYATWGSTFPNVNLTRSIESWFLEKHLYDIKTNECSGVCGHYTQVVWANTQKIGCAYAKCPTLTRSDKTPVQNAIFVVCNYYPAGNYVGAKPYERGAKCSACPDGTKCVDSLCVPA